METKTLALCSRQDGDMKVQMQLYTERVNSLVTLHQSLSLIPNNPTRLLHLDNTGGQGIIYDVLSSLGANK